MRDWLAYFVILITLAIGVSVFLTLSKVNDISAQSDRLVLSFIIAIAFLFVLIFFVGQQLFRLWRERKQRLAGAQLHLRLALLFGVITVIPSILVGLFAVSLIDYSLKGWFAKQISTAVSESVEIANSYFEEHARSVRGQILTMANDINREAPQLVNNTQRLNEYISNQTVLRNLSESVIIDGTGRVLAKSQFAFSITFAKINDALLEKAREGEVVIITSKDNNKLQAIVKLNSFVDAYLLVGRFIDAGVLSALDRTRLAADNYQSLSLRQFDLQISLGVMFSVVVLLLLLSALWLGLNLANSIVEPLVNIIEVAEQVRKGNLNERVAEMGNVDEISRLGASFNRMLDEVSGGREKLVDANKQLDARREFTEAVLGGVTSGVIGLEADGKITLPNQAACELLGRGVADLIGKKLIDIHPEFQPVFDNMSQYRSTHPESQIILQSRNQQIVRQTILRARLTSEREDGQMTGYVLTFNDVTDFLSAQRKAAWADVARRIAHEIKNPLTPITLATDRLMKKYRPKDEQDGQKFDDYLTIISRQVADIGRMVNEFSKFARMPTSILKKIDLVKIFAEQETLLSANNHLTVTLSMPEGGGPVWVNGDAGLLRQLFTNITKNALENMLENHIEKPKIELSLVTENHRAMITIRDYGSGFSGENMQIYLDPYMTTREKGTGLGLAIAQKIITDHHGSIELANQLDQGAEVKLILPLLAQEGPSGE